MHGSTLASALLGLFCAALLLGLAPVTATAGEEEEDAIHMEDEMGPYPHPGEREYPPMLRTDDPSVRTREHLETREGYVPTVVDTGPKTDVGGQINSLDQLMDQKRGQGTQTKGPGLDSGVSIAEEVSTGFSAADMDGYEYCGVGCGGSIRHYHRGGNPVLYYVTCHASRSRCTDNCDECSCAVFNSEKGGTEREHYRDGTDSGRIQLEDATEANSHDWYCYCVKD